VGVIKAFTSRTPYSESPVIEYYKMAFGDYKWPKVYQEYLSVVGNITFNDPELVNEIYITKNRFFEKHPRFKRF
jgi:hypothetical protein